MNEWTPAGTDWMKAGAAWTDTHEKRRQLREDIDALEWQAIPCEGAAMPFLAIKAAIKVLGLPRVSAVAFSAALAPYGLLGIQARYADKRVRVYLIDRGCQVTPLCVDHWSIEQGANDHDDRIRGTQGGTRGALPAIRR